MSDSVTVTLSDGTEEVFTPGSNDIPEPWWVPDEEKKYWSVGVGYTVDAAGTLLVGYGLAKLTLPSENRRTLGEVGIRQLRIVKAYASGRWYSVGPGYWSPDNGG